MSPRPAPSTSDATAHHFLNAAAQLIDAAFVPSLEGRPPRLRAIKFPAALEWLRVEDVVRLAQHNGITGASRKAFHNRWQEKEAFVRSAIVHTMLYHDDPAANPRLLAGRLPGIAAADRPSTAIIQLCDHLLDSLLAHPRSFLMLHIGPLLDQHPGLRSEIVEDMLASTVAWYQGYSDLLESLGVRFRPGWSAERFGLVLQATLDGFLLRNRIQAEQMDACRWQDASLFADTVIALSLGVVDPDDSGLDVRAALDVAAGAGR
jgi:hypothetical protein